DHDLEAICLKCLEKEPRRRYATTEDLANDLQHWRHGEPVRARPIGRAGRLLRWCRRHPDRAAMIVAATVLLTLALATAVGPARAGPRRGEQEPLTASVYAGGGVASRVLWQLDRLSQSVLEAAADPDLVALLSNNGPDDPQRQRDLQERVRAIYRQSNSAE